MPKKARKSVPAPKLKGKTLMNAVDSLISEIHEAARDYRKKHPGDYPPLPGDFPTRDLWVKEHTAWRERNGLPLKRTQRGPKSTQD